MLFILSLRPFYRMIFRVFFLFLHQPPRIIFRLPSRITDAPRLLPFTGISMYLSIALNSVRLLLLNITY